MSVQITIIECFGNVCFIIFCYSTVPTHFYCCSSTFLTSELEKVTGERTTGQSAKISKAYVFMMPATLTQVNPNYGSVVDTESVC